ncbi:MAG TPA: hypothetical protein VMC43_00475 [Candidatus Paceibacterota bacterium]|nr:hypothetical protein [Candidatus Paceibacterota bacterium]
MGGLSPEAPRGYGQDPLHRALGRVEIRNDNPELEKTARDMVREIVKETPAVAEKLIGVVQELRERVEPGVLPRALKLLSAMHEAAVHNIDSYKDYAASFDDLADRVIEALETPEKKETLH